MFAPFSGAQPGGSAGGQNLPPSSSGLGGPNRSRSANTSRAAASTKRKGLGTSASARSGGRSSSS
jgi:hypothetical protein